MVSKRSQILLYDEEYYKYIFKKTEKIVSAVFYTTRSLRHVASTDTIIIDIESVAHSLMDVCHKTLRATSGSAYLRIEDLSLALVELESALTIGVAGGVLDRALIEVFRHEIDSLHRGLKRYLRTDGEELFRTDEPHGVVARQSAKREVPRSLVSGVLPVVERKEKETNRRERILAVIREKTEATIKDISGLITDCSEKTIQRELIGLIKDGTIVREGERRWSKYKIS